MGFGNLPASRPNSLRLLLKGFPATELSLFLSCYLNRSEAASPLPSRHPSDD